MRKVLAFLFFFIMAMGYTQYSISGEFTPAKDFKWMIVYELTPNNQRYIGDAAIAEGHFKLEMPATAVSGMYRLVYAVPQDEFYIDILYDGKEDIQFHFDLKNGITFIESQQNIIFNTYRDEMSKIENKLIDFYSNGQTSETEYLSIIEELKQLQSKFESMQTASLVHEFITANRPYVPTGYESVTAYFNHKKSHYFDHLKMESSILQSSGFLKDKISNYVFSALPLYIKTQAATETAIQDNIRTVAHQMKDTPIAFQLGVFNELWKTADANAMNSTADDIYTNYLKKLATENGQQQLIDQIETSYRLRIGARSPELTWKQNGETKTLSNLEKAEHYILVFWSSTCSHCLKELPNLHTALKDFNTVKIIAVALEEDEENWKKESFKLPFFEHVIALGKWESTYAKLFNIQQTPTYFILDKEKRFISKPDTDKEVVTFLKDN